MWPPRSLNTPGSEEPFPFIAADSFHNKPRSHAICLVRSEEDIFLFLQSSKYETR